MNEDVACSGDSLTKAAERQSGNGGKGTKQKQFARAQREGTAFVG